MGRINLLLVTVLCIGLNLIGCGSDDGITTLADIADLDGYYVLRSATIDGGDNPDITATNSSSPIFVRGHMTIDHTDATHAQGSALLVPINSDNEIIDDKTPQEFQATFELEDETKLLIDFGDGVMVYLFSLSGDTLTLTLDEEDIRNGSTESEDLKRLVIELATPPVFALEGAWDFTQMTVNSNVLPLHDCIDLGTTSTALIVLLDFEDSTLGTIDVDNANWAASETCAGEPTEASSDFQVGYFEEDGNTLRWWLVTDNAGDAEDPEYLEFTFVITEGLHGDPDVLTLTRTDCSSSSGEDPCTNQIPTSATAVPAI